MTSWDGLPSLVLPAELASRWRSTAEDLRRYGAGEAAATLVACATELQEAVQDAHSRPLNLQEAAELSGYSADHLGRLLRDGTLPNAGREGAPRIRVRDLPRKGATSGPKVAPEPSIGEDANAQIVQSIIEGGVDDD